MATESEKLWELKYRIQAQKIDELWHTVKRLEADKQKAVKACRKYRQVNKCQRAEIDKLTDDFNTLCKTMNERMKITNHLNEAIREQNIKIVRLATIIEERGLVKEENTDGE